jgi:hypothetical protein
MLGIASNRLWADSLQTRKRLFTKHSYETLALEGPFFNSAPIYLSPTLCQSVLLSPPPGFAPGPVLFGDGLAEAVNQNAVLWVGKNAVPKLVLL